jgi:hypothetical protein
MPEIVPPPRLPRLREAVSVMLCGLLASKRRITPAVPSWPATGTSVPLTTMPPTLSSATEPNWVVERTEPVAL